LGTRHTTAETRPRLWLWFGLALCIVALARPQWGVIEEQVFDQSREVLIAVDLSKSMLAQDVKPSRLDRAKLLITSLLDGLKGERVGLVLFSGTSFLQSPLSADYEILREFLPALKPDYLPEGGTNYHALLEASIQAFGTSTADRYLIILSDGEATDDDWKSLADSLKTKGIRVIGLGVGTTQGAFIPDPGGGFVKDDRGAVVLSRLNSSTLQELAQLTGGAYADASSWVDLPALLQKTVDAGRKGEFQEKNTARLRERFQWFLAPGLLLLLISFWAEFPVRPRERALPLGKARGQRLEARGQAVARTAALLLVLLLASRLSPLASAAEPPSDPLAAPLSQTVARLAAKDDLDAKDFAELAQTTVTFGERVQSSQQRPVEGAIRDGLAAVDRGAKLDAKAADWPKLRSQLEALLKQHEEEKKKQEEKQQEQQKKDQQKQDQQKQDQQRNQEQKDQEKKQQDQQQQQQQNQPPNQPQKDKDAFGDLKEQPDQPKPPPPPQKPETQKVGGQQDRKPEAQPQNPDLAMPLQKLDQVRDQDSPAKLFQLMQGKPLPPTKPKSGKDW
ncbi:MAG: VWA domain-containing protein, partial [Opitutae bacterium]|nr:VWA domain-containing protein [Opitutae bacterium]